MRRTLMTVPIAIALAVGATLAAAMAGTERGSRPPLSGTVYVTERQVGSVTAFDAASGRPLWTSMTGAVPIGVTRPRWSHKLYTSDEGSNQMSVFDARTGARLTTIAMGPLPHHLMASSDGRRIYVAEFGRATVGVVDTASDTVVAQLAASTSANARTHAVFIDRKDLYTANTRAVRTDPGDVAHIDAPHRRAALQHARRR
jgi:DNA-binding beta-propeller fold protein YncE